MTATQERPALWKAACRVVVSHPVVRWFHTQARRRWLVVAFVVTLALFPLVAWAGGRLGLVMAILVPYALGNLVLAGATGAIFDRPPSRLDERERQVRATVFKNPYYTGLAIGLAAGFVLVFTSRADDVTMMGWMLLVVGAVFALPYLVLAWKLPDDADEYA